MVGAACTRKGVYRMAGTRAKVVEKEAWCDVHKGWVPYEDVLRETVVFSRLGDRRQIAEKSITVQRCCEDCMEERVEKLERRKELATRRREKVA
jgi:hypothetical protein